MSKLFVLSIILYVSQLIPWAHADITITEADNRVTDFTLPYYYTEDTSVTIEDLATKDFKQEVSNSFTFGYVKGDTWFKIKINNQSQQEEFVLTFSEAYMDDYDFYTKIGNHWNKKQVGLHVPLAQREVAVGYPVILLNVPTKKTKTFYLKIHSIFPQVGKLQLFEKKNYFSAHFDARLASYSFYFGGIAIISILNILLFFTLKERIYLLYALYVIFFSAFVLIMSGYDLHIGVANWREKMNVFMGIAMVFFTLFAGHFLELKKNSPKWNQLYNVAIVILLLLSVAMLFEIKPWFQITHVFSTVLMILLLLSAIKVWLQGRAKAIYYIAIMSVIIVASGVTSLVFLGLVENNFVTRYIFIFVSFFEIAMFSFILSHKIYEEKEEKIVIQNQLITLTDKHKKELEKKIEARTNELIQKNIELESIHVKLKNQASREPMTGLHNRRYFTQFAELLFTQAQQNKQPLCVLMLDIDDFKHINDSYGHLVGDKTIISVAEIVQKNTRDNDLTARFGGDEFIILLPSTKMKSALDLANRIKEQVALKRLLIESASEEQNQEEITMSVSISIGVSQLLNSIDGDIDNVIYRADQALYQAKQKGKNCIMPSLKNN